MEGREQKHQMISRYVENTTVQNKWPLILRHKFIQLVYLRENGYDQLNYNKKCVNYVPDNEGSCALCCLSLTGKSVNCLLCSKPEFLKIKGQIEKYC